MSRMDISIAQHLNGLNVDVLKALLRSLGALEKGATSKPMLVSALQRQLQENLNRVVALMQENERVFLAECAHQFGCGLCLPS